jgi:hypothetical protein
MRVLCKRLHTGVWEKGSVLKQFSEASYHGVHRTPAAGSAPALL